MRSFRILVSMLLACASAKQVAVASPQTKEALLERIILDAQGENESKATGGTMTYRIFHFVKQSEPIRLEATVRWDADKAFSSFRLSDPTPLVGGAARTNTIEEATVEYMFQDRDKLYLYNHQTNTLFLGRLEYPRRCTVSPQMALSASE